MLTQTREGGELPEDIISQVHLVDLAGSERQVSENLSSFPAMIQRYAKLTLANRIWLKVLDSD